MRFELDGDKLNHGGTITFNLARAVHGFFSLTGY